jgi:hypothetical protein
LKNITVACFLLLPIITGCNNAPPDESVSAPASLTEDENQASWSDFRDAFIEGYFEFNPGSAVRAGRHEFDGLLHDISPAAISREIAWLKAQRSRALDFDTDHLSPDAAFERDYLRTVIGGELFYLEDSGFLEKNPVLYVDGIDPSNYLLLAYAPPPERMSAFIRHLGYVPAYLEQMRVNLKPPFARPLVEVARSIVLGYVEFFETDVAVIFAGVDDESLWQELEARNANAIAALNATAEWLEAELERADDNFALGEERFLALLRMAEGIDISVADLMAAGQADLERNRQALEAACADFAPGTPLHDCVDRVHSIKPDGGAVESARQQIESLEKFLIEADLVTIPGTEEALVAESPPYARNNLAYIQIPGPYEQALPSTYFIAPPDPAWSPETREAYIPGRKTLQYISVHEVWPGHFLHFLHANRAESPFGRIFQTYTFAEGWAHYSEQLMYDAGLDEKSPESQIGQLREALLRNVRLLSAIGLHTGKMTVEESRQMFQDLAFQDLGNATQQANRGTYDPGYLNYTLGKLMIMKLRDDWTSTRGGRSAWKAFHDTFLSYGGPPIPLVRTRMLGPGYAGDTSLLP